MTFVPTLYYSPGAVSLVSHIALEEAALPYRLELVSLRDGQHQTAAYRRIHPLARVPALEVSPGAFLTETPALVNFVADASPELELLPTERLQRARANEWMSLLASAVHTAFIGYYRPERYTSQEPVAQALRVECQQRFCELLEHVETRLPQAGFALGPDYSLADAYLLVFLLWAHWFDLPVAELPRYRHIAKQVLARPPVRRALEQEGLGAVYDSGAPLAPKPCPDA